MITGLNHITLAVTDLRASLEFYTAILGCKTVHVWSDGAYLEAGDLWLCLSVCDVVEISNDYSHLAFSTGADTLSSLELVSREHGVVFWQANESEGSSLYFLDPDGHKLEAHVGNLTTRMNHIRRKQGLPSGCATDA